MSKVQIGHCMVEAKLKSMDLDNLVVVGDEVGTVPSQASGSMKPLTIAWLWLVNCRQDSLTASVACGWSVSD